MRTYHESLSNQDLDILRGMIGVELNGILSPEVSTRIGSSTYTLGMSASFSFLPIQKDRFVTITNHHRETEGYDDYWKIVIEERTHPKDIGYEKNDIGGALIGNLAMINIWSTITKITIYNYDVADEEEHLSYDAVLLFHFENGLQIGMAPSAILIEITCDEDEIEKMIEGCCERCYLE